MLMLTDRDPALIDRVYAFCESIGLPTTLAQIGLEGVTHAELMAVAQASCQEGETMHNEPYPVTPQRICAALYAADAHGRLRQK